MAFLSLGSASVTLIAQPLEWKGVNTNKYELHMYMCSYVEILNNKGGDY